MTPPIKCILSCFVILATTSDIRTKEIRELELPRELIVMRDRTIIFGEAMNGKIPVITYSFSKGILDMSVFLNTSIYVLSGVCDSLLEDLLAKSLDFKTLKLLATNRILILRTVTGTDYVRATALVIHTDSCVSKVTFDQKWPLSAPNTAAVVTYPDGYDVITSLNERLRFDVHGNKLSAKPEFFPTNSTAFFVHTLANARDKGYYIVDYTHEVIKFTIPHETEKGVWKNRNWIYTKDAQILTNSEHSLYSVCGYNPNIRTTITCYQFDELGNEMWIHSAQPEFDTVLDVKSLAGGGLVFAAFKSEGNKLIFVRIGNKLDDVNIWSYSGKQKFQDAIIIDYSEKDRTFALAYKTSQLKTFQQSIISQKFSLQN